MLLVRTSVTTIVGRYVQQKEALFHCCCEGWKVGDETDRRLKDILQVPDWLHKGTRSECLLGVHDLQVASIEQEYRKLDYLKRQV